MKRARLFNEFVSDNKSIYVITLFATIIFLVTMSGWVKPLEKQLLGSVEESGRLSFYKETINENVILTIDNFFVKDLEPKGAEVTLHLIIENNGKETIKNTNIVVPWDQRKDFPFQEISDIKINTDEVTIENSITEIIYASKDFDAIPVTFRKVNSSQRSTSIIFRPYFSNTAFVHQFGHLLRIEWKRPIENGTKRDFTISFKIDNIKYRDPNKFEKYFSKLIRVSPFNFYPFSGTYQLKMPFIFPFADEVHIANSKVNLPFGYSAKRYDASTFTIEFLNRTLEPRAAYGFLLYTTKLFNEDRDCEKHVRDVWDINGVVPIRTNGCILKFPSPIFTEEMLYRGERWYLSTDLPSVSNELSLMKFAFNPTFFPSYEISPGILLLVVNYKLAWWNNLIPIIFVFIIIIFSYIQFGKDSLTIKTAILISLIVALIGYWGYTFAITPQIHPNLLDIMFIVTLFIAIFSMADVNRLDKFNIVYPFFVSVVLIIIQFSYPFSADLLLRLALILPIVSFATLFPTISIIFIFYTLSLIQSPLATGNVIALWVLRLLFLVFLMNYLKQYFASKINLNYNFLKKFISYILSITIIWNVFTFLIYLNTRTLEFQQLVNNVFLLPIGLTILLVIRDKISNKLK